MFKKNMYLLALISSLVAPASLLAAENYSCSDVNQHRAIFNIKGIVFDSDNFTMNVEDKGSAVVSYNAKKEANVTITLSNGDAKVFRVQPGRVLYVVNDNVFYDAAVCNSTKGKK